MEDKNLNSNESLELITRMIAQTRNNFEHGGGALFLIWGYTSIVVAVADLVISTLTHNPIYLWLWWAIPVIGGLLTYLNLRNKPKQVKTYVDKFLGHIWLTIGIVAIVFPMVGMFNMVVNFMIIPFEALLLSVGIIQTGLTLKFRTLVVCGFMALVLSLLVYFIDDCYTYVFIAMIIIGMIIPGHILNHKGRCLKN